MKTSGLFFAYFFPFIHYNQTRLKESEHPFGDIHEPKTIAYSRYIDLS